MKVSQNWLKKFVEFKYTPEQFTEKLSMVGLEVESYEDLAQKYHKFVVGEVLEKTKHPNADRLTLCKVNVGGEVLQIVCGAPNVEAGQKVAVALLGALIPHNQHDPEGQPFTIERVKIRGVESTGMICSQYELDLGKDADGILILDQKAKVGTPLAKYFSRIDVIYEIGITPNRSDCLSHIGVAREIGALVNKKIKLPSIIIRESKTPAKKFASIVVKDKNRCPRYSARVVRNVRIGPSPEWLQDLLASAGVRPINNIVDVTNFVLLETGHPLHAFDYDKLAGHAIVVKTAQQGDTFVTLDGKERPLTSEILMICDAEKPIAIGGVMGGANTEISDSTKNVLIEGAYFDPSSIRRTSKYLGLSTEASYRFERGTDIDMTVTAVNRAAQLMQELAGGEVLHGVLDAYPKKRKHVRIKARVSRINSVIGTERSKAQIIALLKKIDLKAQSKSKDEVLVDIPNFRNDLLEEIDIIEEVARVFGYNNIETKTHASIDFTSTVRTDLFEDNLRDYFVGSGFNEILSISLQDEETALLGGETPIKVINAVSAEMMALRTSFIPGALRIVAHNCNHGSKDLRLFEIGSVFSQIPDSNPADLLNYIEEQHLLILLSGSLNDLGYGVEQRQVDILDMKGELSSFLHKFNLDNYRFIYYDNHKSLTEPCIGIEINGTYAGYFGKIPNQTTTRLNIEETLFVCELKTQTIRENWVTEKKFISLPKFPNVSRDLAFTVDGSVPQNAIEEVIRQSGQPLLTRLKLFDVFSSSHLGAGKKSLAYSLEFQANDRTLTDNEIEKSIAVIVKAVQQQCNGTLRS